jgi:hypothetical protein
MNGIFSRVLAAAPDLLTSAIFLSAWIAPSIPGPRYVNDLVMAMFLQTFLLFASGLYGQIVLDRRSSRLSNLFILTVMSAVIVFIMINVLAQDSPNADHSVPSRITFEIYRPELLIAFVWLFASNFMHLLFHRLPDNDADRRRIETLSTLSIAAYVFGFAAALLLPLPPLGMTPEFIATLNRGEGDMWGKLLYVPIAFGVIYFATQACIKAVMLGPPPPPRTT